MKQTIKIDIISGFLGAGKTTLINKLLAEAYAGERVALLENEFGEIGIDGDLLQGSGITVKELANGCICCTLQGDFVDGIRELVETCNPERIIIEPTGLAKLLDIIAPCKKAAESLPLEINLVVSLVNAASYTPLINVGGEFFTNQIIDAWFILISAVQDIPDDDMSLAEIVESIRTLNDKAPIFTDPWDTTDGLTLLTAAEQAAVMGQATAEEQAAVKAGQDPHEEYHHDHEHDSHHDHVHDHNHDTNGFSSVSFHLKSPWTAEKVQGLAAIFKSGECGEVFRAKGLLPTDKKRALKFDYVYGTVKLIEIDFPGEGKLVIIGRDLKTDRLESYLKV
ncbi:cobalamin synthesis protein CobW [Treponema primitia ZAS-2]|uniref:Cobalamin synthesis protein CobW n=1 Tax=Treponema primitia (strain ATCC BAA-887 / DSM 12427 / ZAS-2) TaxID=545694 RepID=F5YP98_TREPZ|nr:GTP-binding protein [Treponema primitia]AEF83532.1 cobalamin synthesis protein CobW [Treponema primitia ZAS-2]